MARSVAERADIVPVLAEIFREHGYEGASLAVIGGRTGLGKGSLYHFFPGGKEEMAAAVLAEIAGWFETRIYRPLAEASDPQAAICTMIDAVEQYFHSGRRICLVGAFALDQTRDRFAGAVSDYFLAWARSLTAALARAGHAPERAADLAEDAISGIQGALVLARALGDPGQFGRALDRIRTRLQSDPQCQAAVPTRARSTTRTHPTR